MLKNLCIVTLLGVWGLLIGSGFVGLWCYGSTPGERETPPGAWPESSRIARHGRPTLLVFAHPLCPCTRATLTELENLLAVCGDRLDAHVIFIAPTGADASWQNAELCRRARGLAGVTCLADGERHETRLFGARTSGTCLLYDRTGCLLFHGGLTAARGEIGQNDGRRAIEKLAQGQDSPVGMTPTFGCPLFEPGADCGSACKKGAEGSP